MPSAFFWKKESLAKKTFHFLLEKRKFAKKTNMGPRVSSLNRRPAPRDIKKKRKLGNKKQYLAAYIVIEQKTCAPRYIRI